MMKFLLSWLSKNRIFSRSGDEFEDVKIHLPSSVLDLLTSQGLTDKMCQKKSRQHNNKHLLEKNA
jgi:hypothetical protein